MKHAEQVYSLHSPYCWPNHTTSMGSRCCERHPLRVHLNPRACSISLRLCSLDIYISITLEKAISSSANVVVYDELEVTHLTGRFAHGVTRWGDLASAGFMGVGRDVLRGFLFDDGRLGDLGGLISLPLELNPLLFKFLFLLVEGFDVGGEQSLTGLDLLLIILEYFLMGLHRLVELPVDFLGPAALVAHSC